MLITQNVGIKKNKLNLPVFPLSLVNNVKRDDSIFLFFSIHITSHVFFVNIGYIHLLISA